MNFEIIPNQQTPKVPNIDNVQEFLNNNKELLNGFLEFASNQHNAVGLAANQVSDDGERLMIKVFAKRIKGSKDWMLVINPEITDYIGIKEYKAEGCLTWKGKGVIAERSRAVDVNYYDIEGVKHTERHIGFEGQIWQHETNHLNGIEETVTDDFVYIHSIRDVDAERNDPCPCGSGKKYKQCCLNLK